MRIVGARFIYYYINIIWHYHIIIIWAFRPTDRNSHVIIIIINMRVCELTPIVQMWFFLFFFVVYITRTHLTPTTTTTTLIVAVVFDVAIELSSSRCTRCMYNDNKRAAAPWLYTFVAIISNILRTFVHNIITHGGSGGGGTDNDDGRTMVFYYFVRSLYYVISLYYYILFDNIFSGS